MSDLHAETELLFLTITANLLKVTQLADRYEASHFIHFLKPTEDPQAFFAFINDLF